MRARSKGQYTFVLTKVSETVEGKKIIISKELEQKLLFKLIYST